MHAFPDAASPGPGFFGCRGIDAPGCRFRFRPDSASFREWVCSGRCEAVPDFTADLVAEQVGQGFAAMHVEVVQDQVDGRGCRVLESQVEGHFGELECGPIRRGEGEVAADFRLYRAEDVGGASAFIFVILSGFAARFGGRSESNVGVQRDWLFVQTDHGLLAS